MCQPCVTMPKKAWVNIMYGCDKFCTYCIVPYTRGKERSRSMDDILEEVNTLKKEGYQDITFAWTEREFIWQGSGCRY